MKTVQFYAKDNRRRSGPNANCLHIETDGCVVNVYVGLHGEDGQQITRVDVSPDNASRGGDGSGNIWEIHPGDGLGVTRVVMVTEAT